MCLDVAEGSCLNHQQQQPSIFVLSTCQIKGPASGFPLCILLQCHVQWTQEGDQLLSEMCVGEDKKSAVFRTQLFYAAVELARIKYTGRKKKGNNCILM